MRSMGRDHAGADKHLRERRRAERQALKQAKREIRRAERHVGHESAIDPIAGEPQ